MKEIKFRYVFECRHKVTDTRWETHIQMAFFSLSDIERGAIQDALNGFHDISLLGTQNRIKARNLFTGLKDKNGKGKETWTGDIISHRNIDKIKTDGVVHFDWRGACIIVSGNYVRLNMIPNWEVIGNIYENPELLELKQERDKA